MKEEKCGNISNIPNSINSETINTSPAGSGSISRPAAETFRNWFLAEYGYGEEELKDSRHLELLRLAAYLLPGGYENREDDEHEMRIVMSHAFVTSLVRPGRTGKNLNVRDLLAEFETTFWKLEIIEADRFEGKAMSIVGQSYPLDLKDKWDESIENPNESWVDFVTGDPWTPPPEEPLPSSPVPEVEDVRRHLNSLDPSHFTSILPEIDRVIKKVMGRKDWTAHQKRHQSALLRQVALNPKPLYKAVEGTTRLYAHGASFLGLAREVREELTGSFWKFDLSAAQLRIASALWGFDLIVDPSDKSVWTYLLKQNGFKSHNKAAKQKLKDFVYPALFGQCKTRLQAKARRSGMPGLMKDPLIISILKKRDEVIERLVNGETMSDAWGNTYSAHGETTSQKTASARSAMAAICQSYELKILMPVFEYARDHGLTVAALLHDGIYCLGDWTPHVQEVQRLAEQASLNSLGIQMPLIAKNPRSNKI